MKKIITSDTGLNQAVTNYKKLHMNLLRITAKPIDNPKITAEFQFRFYERDETTGKRQYANLEDDRSLVSWSTADLEKYAQTCGDQEVATKIAAVISSVQQAAAAIMTKERGDQVGTLEVAD